MIDTFKSSYEYNFISYETLSTYEKKVFDLNEQVVRAYGAIEYLDKIFISETIRPDFYGRSSLGVFDEGMNIIIIRRDQLKNKSDYLGVLIHELVHARQGLSDVSRDFENELTRIIGRLADAILQNDFPLNITTENSNNNYQNLISNKLSGYVSLENLFNEEFVKMYTSFNTIGELFTNYSIEIKTQEAYDNINRNLFDSFISDNSEFSTYSEMVKKATPQYIKQKIKMINSRNYIEQYPDYSLVGINNIYEYLKFE